MPLSNAQYEELLRRYDARRLAAEREAAERRATACEQIPELREIEESVARAGIAAVRDRIAGIRRDPGELQLTLSRLSERRRALLSEHGLPENYLEPAYTCAICEDTGRVDGAPCICFREAETALLRDSYHLGTALDHETFSRFSFDWYDDAASDTLTGQSPLENARDAFAKARYTASHIGEAGSSLFLYGETGLGKTFLTHCIAKEALEEARTALYYSAPALFDVCADAAFGRREDAAYEFRQILTCDLLLIDDLGTEVSNSFSASQLFRCVNERLSKDRTIVISSNLSPGDLRDRYSERIFSRIVQSFQIVKLTGKDIRLQKKLQGGAP